MEYGLLSTEASFAFLLILMIIYFTKQQYKSGSTTCYKVFLISSIIYQLLLFISVCLIKYLDLNMLTRYVWRLQYIFMFISWNLFVLYGYVTLKKVEETNFFKMIKSDKELMGLFASPIMIAIAFLLPFDYKIIDTVTKTSIVYYDSTMSIILLVLTITSITFYVINIYKRRNTVSKNFIFMNFVAITTMATLNLFHIFYNGLSFYPLAFTLIAYTIYFLIENPDIIMMDEIKRMQHETNNEEEEQDNFLANVDDKLLELVNKINVISIEDIENTNISEEVIKKLTQMKQDSEVLVDEMTKILDASKYQEEEIKVDDRKYETKELLKKIMLFAQEKIQGKNIKLMFNINPNIPSKFYGDIEKIYQALENVIKYSSENTRLGRIVISISSKKIENVEEITFKIVDTGEGINSEEIPYLFDESKTKYKELYFSKRTVDVLKGKMWCESQFKIGTKVFIQIVQKIADTTPLGDISKINEETIVNMKDIDYSKYKVLLVDDNMINNKLTKKILEEKKFNVEVVSSGEECIRKIKSEEEIDLIFMDIMMPIMDGVETLKVLKDLDGYILPPIVALTANALPGMKETYLSQGFDDYLAKPLSIKALENVLRMHLKEQKDENI